MISICTVLVGLDTETENNQVFESIFLESIVKKLPYVSEVVMCQVDAKKYFHKEINLEGKRVVKFGYPNDFFRSIPSRKLDIPFDFCDKTVEEQENVLADARQQRALYDWNIFLERIRKFGHPYGMRAAIKKATNDLVLLCDPDIFFYNSVDEFFLRLMEKYSLSYIGAAPHLAMQYATKYFPNILCLLTRRSSLPVGEIEGFPAQVSDEYLLGVKCEEIADQFPEPTGLFETGVYLWLWAERQKQNWLSFPPDGLHLHTSLRYRSNLKIRDRLENRNLFYHATGGCRSLYLKQFIEEYKKS